MVRNPILSQEKNDKLQEVIILKSQINFLPSSEFKKCVCSEQFLQTFNINISLFLFFRPIKYNPGSIRLNFFKRKASSSAPAIQNIPLLRPFIKPSACYRPHHIPVLFLSPSQPHFLSSSCLLPLSASPNICVARLRLSTVTQPINKLPYML